MFGLTLLGILHTLISLVAVATGAIALIRYKEITSHNRIGQIYVITTVVTCLTGFGIFQHGGFGQPHALGIITLVVLSIALIAERNNRFSGSLSPYIRTIAFTTSFFFHLVPGITETATRLPVNSPLVPNPDAPELQTAIGICFTLFLIGVIMQVLSLRKRLRP